MFDPKNLRNRIVELRRVKASDLLANPKNWREHGDEQRAAVSGALDELGFADALKARETPEGLELIDGHLRADLSEGAEIPVLVLDLNDEETALFLAACDPLAAMATTNAEKLEALLLEVTPQNEALAAALAGLSTLDPTEETSPEDLREDADAIPQEDAPDPITEPGDLWKLGQHRLKVGDSTNAEHVAHLLDGKPAEVVLTDPPYCSGGFQEAGRSGGSIGTRDSVTIQNDQLSTRGYQRLIGDVLKLYQPGLAYVFTDWRQWVNLFDVMEGAGLGVRSMIVWDKGSPGMGRGWRNQHELIMMGCRVASPFKPSDCAGNVIPCGRTGNDDHPTQKPVDLLREIMRVSSFAGLFVDPFAGSGSTLIAGERSGVPVYAMEMAPRYADTIIRRWEDLTGEEAERVE